MRYLLLLTLLMCIPFAAQADKGDRSGGLDKFYEQEGVAYPEAPHVETFTKDTIKIKKQNGEVLHFNVELATNTKEQSQGLMFRTELAEDAGMLFLFNTTRLRNFWMKNTLIPLDILFLHPDGHIHHIHHSARPQDLTRITSKYPSRAALEIPGGVADRMGISEGDQVLHAAFNNAHIE